MKATIMGVGEWRPPAIRYNHDWPEETLAKWRARAQAQHSQASQEPKQSFDATALVDAPDLGEADRLSAIGFTKDTEDLFLWAKERRISDPSIRQVEGAANAGKAAIADAGIDPREIDLLICWDAVPDRPGCPGAPKVAELVGATGANAIDIQQACASVVSSLELAAAMIESGRARYALLTQTHLAMRVFGFETPVSANVGDLTTALVVGPSERPGILTTSVVSDGRFQNAVLMARGKDDESDTPWYVAGGPFVFGTKDRVNAQLMMKETVKMGALTIREACERGRIDTRDIEVICAPHPRRWIPGAVAETLGLPGDRAPHVYETIAHVGGCGTVANLIEARRRGMLREGTKVALYAQGQGMTRAAAIVTWGAR